MRSVTRQINSLLILGALLAFTMVACSSSGTVDISPTPSVPSQTKITGITIPTSGSVDIGSTLALTAAVSPTNATNKAVTWTSDDATVATVSASGLVAGLKAGTSAITARASDGSNIVSNRCLMTVAEVPSPVEVTGITIPASGSVDVGSTLALMAAVSPADATNKAVTWTTDDATVATVSASGLVTGLKAGTAGITARASDGSNVVSNRCLVTVAEVPSQVEVTGITIPASGSMNVGSTLALTAAVSPANATNKAVTWATDDATVATVSASGLLTGLKAGTAGITARATDGSNVVSNSCLVTVSEAPPAGSLTCTEFGRLVWSDFASVSQGPPVNFFVGAWTRVVKPVGSGGQGNNYPFVLDCSETVQGRQQQIATISGNIGYDIGAGIWFYNQNITTQTGDHVTWYAHDTEAVCRDWTYVGWHFQKIGTNTLATQYLKFGTTGSAAITSQETLLNETCTPVKVYVGGGLGGWSGDMYLQYAKVYALDTPPTAAQVDGIALRTAADASAWADWPLIAGDVSDVSGHGRSLSITGSLYEGPAGPQF